jgi:hypothetical protein
MYFYMGKKNSEKKKTEEGPINPKYEEIVKYLVDEKIGGIEYCLRQLLYEGDHRELINNYKTENKNTIFEKISNFYESTQFEEKNFKDVDVLSGLWNKYMLKIYYYDRINYKFFEYSIKTDKVEEVSMFEIRDAEESKDYNHSFFSKIKGGNSLWLEYEKVLNDKKSEEQLEKVRKELMIFSEKMKKFKFIPDDELGDFKLEEADDQYRDGKTRYLHDKKMYYRLVGINGYITFDSDTDIMLEPIFAKHFYDKIVKKLREQ